MASALPPGGSGLVAPRGMEQYVGVGQAAALDSH